MGSATLRTTSFLVSPPSFTKSDNKNNDNHRILSGFRYSGSKSITRIYAAISPNGSVSSSASHGVCIILSPFYLFIYFKFHVVQLCQFVFWFLYFMSCTLKIMFFVSKTLNLYIKDNKEGML